MVLSVRRQIVNADETPIACHWRKGWCRCAIPTRAVCVRRVRGRTVREPFCYGCGRRIETEERKGKRQHGKQRKRTQAR